MTDHRTAPREYKVSWWRQYSRPVRLSWWRRRLGQERTCSVWVNHHCVVTLTDHQLEALGGWDVVSKALLVPLIHAVAGNYTNLAMPTEPAITATPGIVGLQVEEEWRENSYVRTNLLPHSGRSVADVAAAQKERK